MKWRGISTDSTGQPAAYRSLGERLMDIKAGIAQYVRPENQAVNLQTVAALKNEGREARALKVGDVAPSFTVQDQSGKALSSQELLAHGPLIINFFRGRWCPFCIAELETWHDLQGQVTDAGASLLAISPQTVRHNAFTADQHQLRFPLLSDPACDVAARFGVAYQVPPQQLALYRAVFVNLQHLSGNDSGVLPLPATFVVNRDGAISFAFVDADYTTRAEPEAVLSAIKPL